jgi:hypothetical protein
MSRSGRKPAAAVHQPVGAADHNPSLTLALLIASVLTGGVVGFLSASPWIRVGGVTLTAATIWFSYGHLKGRVPFLGALLPGLGVLALFIHRVAVMTPPFLLPRLHVAGLLAWGVLALALVLVESGITDEDRGFVIAFALGALLFLGELVLPGPQQVGEERWEALYLADPLTGPRFLPGSTARNLYSENPRRYFDRVDAWQLESHQGSLGRLERVAPDGSHLRVSMPRLVGDQNWQIKLLRAPFHLYIGRSYQLRFRARSDSIREINCAAGQNHEPWQLLSPYREVQLKPEWNEYSCAFIAGDTDANARVFFDLGKTRATVEVSDVSLHDLSRGEVVNPPDEFYVTYRFDSRGSLGPDRETPSPRNAFRIVVLGDSRTMGEGVREEDTFTARLERLLNDGRSPGDSTYFEVINSGLPGFDTRLERVLYETVSHLYEPDLVLVVMHYDDDMSSAEVEQAGFLPPPPRLSRLIGLIEAAIRPERPWDYTRSIAELETLASEVGERSQKLAVAFFRGDSAEPWEKLVADVTAGLQGKNVPTLDLGEALLGSDHSESELAVVPGDEHYNEIAHGIAAQSLEKFLRAENLIPTAVLAANGGL